MPPEASTETKLARMRDVGLLFSLSLVVRPLVDRPRVSGEGELSPALFSKRDRRLRTAEEVRSEEVRSVDMAVSQSVGQ